MAQSLHHEVGEALAAAGLRPLHRFGQNFMVDQVAVQTLIETVGAGPGVRICEIGPGTGVLTSRMLDAGAAVLAVEIDQGLAGLLTATLVPRGLQLVHSDCLASKTRLHQAIEDFAAAGPWRLGANLPYDAALPAILNAIALPRPPERIVVTIQREAAERLISKPGSDAWGASAAVLQAAGTARIARRLGPACFFPRPRVDSAILAFDLVRPLPDGFGGFCRNVFAYRRKVLPGCLADAGWTREAANTACASAGIDPSRRLENLNADELLALHAVLPPGTRPV
jgi:16S rRNA (adenine1518-N6/adenine1519-N6)-dimethyltransferase